MAVRTDITFFMEVSPRIIQVQSPSTELTVQDLHDTASDFEDSVEGGQYPRLILSAGGEALGGGVTVGLTSTLQNAQVQFQGRTTPTETGTCTSDDTTGTVLQAASGQFVTNGVSRGDTVFNSTTGSMATVLSVASETQLTSQVLSGGARATWLNTDGYSIYVNVQCNISGGNLVALDGVGGDISPVLQSPNTNVIRTASSSTTSLSQEALENSLFFKGVVIDAVEGLATSEGLVGYLNAPVQNDVYAVAAAEARGLRDYFLIGTNVLTADHSAGYTFTGADALQSVAVLATGSFDFCTFRNLVLTGAGGPSMLVSESIVQNLSGATGILKECGIVGTLTMGNVGNNGLTQMARCIAIAPGLIVDAAAAGSGFKASDMQGDYTFINKTGTEDFFIALDYGSVTVDASCTGGSIEIRGSGTVIDNSGVGCTVIDNTVLSTSGEVWADAKALTASKFLALKDV